MSKSKSKSKLKISISTIVLWIIFSPIVYFAFFSLIAVFVEPIFDSFFFKVANLTVVQSSTILTIIGLLIFAMICIQPYIRESKNQRRSTLIDNTVSTCDIGLVNHLLKNDWVIFETGYCHNFFYMRLKNADSNSEILPWDESLSVTYNKNTRNGHTNNYSPYKVSWIESNELYIKEVESKSYWGNFDEFSKRFPNDNWVLLSLDKDSHKYIIGLIK